MDERSKESTIAFALVELIITSPFENKASPDNKSEEVMLLFSESLISYWSVHGLYSSISVISIATCSSESFKSSLEWALCDINKRHANCIKILIKLFFMNSL